MKIDKLGVQLFSIRDFMTTPVDIRESFRKLKAIGYEYGQMAGKMHISYEEFGRIAREENFEIIGTHENFNLMVNDFEKSYDNHMALGTKIMGASGIKYDNVTDWKRFIEQANIVGEKIAERGGIFTYHNHALEFIKLEGKIIMDYLYEGMDPTNTGFVLDTYWVQAGGADVRYWIEKLTGRIEILHLKDMGRTKEESFITEVGQGNMYWEGIMEAAECAGVRHYVVEQDFCSGDPFESLKISSDYIHSKFM